MVNQKLLAERDWMLHVENMAVVRQCRRKIQEEFGVKLNLNSEDLLRSIQDYADRSQNATLRRLARPVINMLLEQDGEFGGSKRRTKIDLTGIPVLGSNTASHSGWAR